ncbi:MAG: hypothetical protein ACD_69C00180G0005, partial [uncultured bacterium]
PDLLAVRQAALRARYEAITVDPDFGALALVDQNTVTTALARLAPANHLTDAELTVIDGQVAGHEALIPVKLADFAASYIDKILEKQRMALLTLPGFDISYSGVAASVRDEYRQPIKNAITIAKKAAERIRLLPGVSLQPFQPKARDNNVEEAKEAAKAARDAIDAAYKAFPFIKIEKRQAPVQPQGWMGRFREKLSRILTS